MPSKIKSGRIKSPPMNDFMKKSMISPKFQYNSNDSNYLNSHASHIDEPVTYKSNELKDGSEDSYDYVSTTDDSYTDDETNGNGSNKITNPNTSTNTSTNATYASRVKETDLKIYKMKDLLDKKKNLMFNKERKIKEIGNQNSFLETVVSDYEKYNSAILEEKVKQKKALKILSEHIRNISKNINSDEFKLKRVKRDQTLLLEEIQNIRDEIEYMLRSSGSSKTYVSSDEENGSEYSSEYGSDFDSRF